MHLVIINLTMPLPKEVQHLPVKASKEPKRKVSDCGLLNNQAMQLEKILYYKRY